MLFHLFKSDLQFNMCAEDTKIIVFGSAGSLSNFLVPQITRHKKIIYLYVPVKDVFFF